MTITVIRWILNHRSIALFFILIPTLYFAWSIKKLEINTNQAVMFQPDDPDLLFYQQFYEEFGSDEFLLVYFSAPNVFEPGILSMIDRLTEKFEKLPYVDQVISLTSFNTAYNVGDTLVIGSLSDELNTIRNSSQLESIRERILSDLLYYKTLIVSKDGKGTLIAIPIQKLTSPTYKYEIVSEVRKIVQDEENRSEVKMVIGGTPFYQVALDETYKEDSEIITPILVLMVFLVMFAIFRNIGSALVPLGVVGLSVVWTFGFVGAVGKFLTPLTEIILPLLLVYGVLSSVHLLSAVRSQLNSGKNAREAILEATHKVAVPCFLASFTTALGFLSLLTSSVTIIQDLGLYATFGIMTCYLLTFVLVPMGLDRFHWMKMETLKSRKLFTSEFLLGLSQVSKRYYRAVVLGSLLFIVSMGFWISQIEVDNTHLKLFKEDAEVVQNERYLANLMGPWAPLEMLITVNGGGSVLRGDVLQEIEKLQGYLENLPSIDKSLSVVDVLKKANQELRGGSPDHYRLPSDLSSTERLVGFLGAIGGQRGLNAYLSEDHKRARLTARTSVMSSKQFLLLFDGIQDYIQRNISPVVNVQSTGEVWLGSKLMVNILNTEIQSFSLAFVLIFLLIAFALKSWRLGLIAIIPNIFPVVVILAIMGKVGINLDVGTCTVASIVIAMAVDDTVHFLYKFREELKVKENYAAAIAETMKSVGPPIVYTSLVLAAGFWVLIFSSYVPALNFGFLSGVAVLAALIGDIVILPALLVWFRPIRS